MSKKQKTITETIEWVEMSNKELTQYTNLKQSLIEDESQGCIDKDVKIIRGKTYKRKKK